MVYRPTILMINLVSYYWQKYLVCYKYSYRVFLLEKNPKLYERYVLAFPLVDQQLKQVQDIFFGLSRKQHWLFSETIVTGFLSSIKVFWRYVQATVVVEPEVASMIYVYRDW